jgi:hypothetical protein
MLTLQFIPYDEIEDLNSDQRIRKLLRMVKDEKIVLMQGRLKPEEETSLIETTMGGINKMFKGIEMCTIYPEEKGIEILSKLRKGMAQFLVGHREGITIIGPANIIKEIRRDPNKIQLLTTIPSPRKSRSAKTKKNVKKAKKRRR